MQRTETPGPRNGEVIMPKTNDNTGATAAGFTGIVEHAAPLADGRKFSELDPERNLDGSLIAGEHADEQVHEQEQHSPGEAPAPLEEQEQHSPGEAPAPLEEQE